MMASFDEMRKQGFEQCTFAGECDFCHCIARLGDLFWYRTSFEYVEGDYYCRSCVENTVTKYQRAEELERVN